MSKHIVFILIVNVFFSACAKLETSHFPSGDLTVATVIPIGEVKPFSSRLGIGANLIELLYRPLFRLSSDGKLIPELAKEIVWDASQSSLRVLLFEDKADDVLFTINTVKDRNVGDFAESLRNLLRIQKISNNEIRFVLTRYDRAFQTLLTQLPIISSLDQQPTGEFDVSKIDSEEVVLNRKRPSSHLVNKITIKQISSPRRVIRELVAGNVDVAFFPDEGEFKVVFDIENIKIGELKSRMLYLVLQKNGRGKTALPWKELNEKLDRGYISEQLGEFSHVPAFAPIPWGDFWATQEDSLNKQNVVQSNTYPKMFPDHKLSFLGRQNRQIRLSRILKRKFDDFGIHLVLNELTQEEFFQQVIIGKDFDLLLIPYVIKDTLMSNYLIFHSPEGKGSLNLSGYSNATVDKYLELARYTQDDESARSFFSKAIQSMNEDPPGLFLFWLKIPIVYRQSCSGFKFSSNEFFSSLKDVRCEPSAAN